MIFRTNLASRPTRNYTLYFMGCLLVLVVAVGFTAYNLRSLLASLREARALNQQIQQQRQTRSEYQKQAADLRVKITAIKTPAFISETEFLNDAIQRRVFSWTGLFDLFERVFPNNVRMLSVTPGISGSEIGINMEVAGRSLNDIVELIKVLQGVPSFSDVVFRSEAQEKDGSIRASISLRYQPERNPEQFQDDGPGPEGAGSAEKAL